MTQEDHFDVASYALGVLDANDAARFEDHLIECPRCAYELESFVEVADLLAEIDAPAVVAAEESRRDGLVLQKVIGSVKQERKKSNSRRLYSLAAAVVVFAMLSIGAFFFGQQGTAGNDGTNTAIKNTSTPPRDNSMDALPPDGVGLGGPELTGKRWEGTDPRTNVSIAVGLEQKDMGTQIQYALSNIKGPRVCRIVAVHTDGTSEQVGSWVVKGSNPTGKPTLLTAITATPRDRIAYIQITDDKNETLVRVP